MQLESVLPLLGGVCFAEALRPHWEESAASLPAGTPSFLEPGVIHEHRVYCGLDDATEPVLLAAARRILADPVLKLLAWHGYRRLIEWPDDGDFHVWPAFDAQLGEFAGCFYLLLGLSIVPSVRAAYQALGVPESVTQETLLQVWAFSHNYDRGTRGRVGMYPGQLHWTTNYVAGRLFRCDRFEFRLGRFPGWVRVYRHRAAGHIVALSEDGLHYNARGFIAREADPDPWTATLHADATGVTGYPVAPQGHVLHREVRLSHDAWECVVQPGDPTLDMHIPAGGQMTPERCANSFRRAVDFFRRYFPETPAAVFSCNSWIFGPQLEDIFPADANLVRLLRDVYLCPVGSPPNGGLWFIYYQENIDPATAPRDTSVQRAVADHLAAGGDWRTGGMFLLAQDLDRLAAQPYRTQWPEVQQALGLT